MTCQDAFRTGSARLVLQAKPIRPNKTTSQAKPQPRTKLEAQARFESQLIQAANDFGLPSNWITTEISFRPRSNAITEFTMMEIDSTTKRFRSGPRIWLNHATDKSPLEIAELMIPKNYPSHDAIGDIVTAGDQRFRFANIGARQMRDSTRVIDEMIETRYAHSIEVKQVQIPIAQEWLIYHQKMEVLQSTLSLMTMETYKARKPYLLDDDLVGLRMNDGLVHARNEYLVVMNEIGKPVHEMTLHEFRTNLVASMRLARAGHDRDITGIDISHDRRAGTLPSLSRLSGRPREMLQRFYAGLESKGLKVAEITRFSRFQSAPPEIMKSLILRMFEFSKHRTDPVDIFVMEVDALTRQLFADYGLKELVKLPVEGNESPEYIMTVDARTPEFAIMMTQLRNDAREASVSPAPVPKEVLVTRIPGKEYFAQEDSSALASAHPRILKANWRRRLRAAKPPRSDFNGDFKMGFTTLHSRAVETVARARAIANLVAKIKIDKSLNAQVDAITASQQRVLFERVTRYSKDFENVMLGINRLPSQGRILIVNEGVETYSRELRRLFPDRQIEVISEAQLADQPATSAEAILFNHIFTPRRRPEWPETFERARRVLKRNRVLLSVEAWSDKSWKEEYQPDSFSLQKLLREYSVSALRNGSPMTETDLALSLILARRFFERSISSSIDSQQLAEAAEQSGYVRSGYGTRASWLSGGVLNRMIKE